MALRSTRWQQASYRWVERPSIDYLLAGAVATAVTLICAWRSWGQPLASAEAPARRALYQVIAGLSGTLLGLTLTSLSLLVGLIRTPVAQLDLVLSGEQRVRMAKTFVAALFGLGLAFLLSGWAILDDTKDATKGSPIVQTIVFGVVMLGALRIGRVVWIVWKLLEITAQGSTAAPDAETTE